MENDFAYKKYWIGRCFQKNDTMNLNVGCLYLLKDKSGNQEFFHASTQFDRSQDYFGAYRSTQFEVLLDVTDAILALPYDYSADDKGLRLQLILLVASQNNIAIEEAEALLVDKGIILTDKEEVESTTPRPSSIPTAKPTHLPKVSNEAQTSLSKEEPKSKPVQKTAEKPKLVQKGLFG